MATTSIQINDTTWTEVLDGEGFVVAPAHVQYSFNSTDAITDFFQVPKKEPVHGTDGQKLYARSNFGYIYVASSPKT